MENQHHETYEKARKRTKQKRSLYFHFVLFLVGSIFLIVLNQIFHLGEEEYGSWFVWAIMLWLFFWIIHFANVVFIKRFFGTDWERKETEKLVAKHIKKVEKLEKKLINEGVISPDTEKKTLDN